MISRYLAFALMVIYGCANYQDGAQHYKEATAESDSKLFFLNDHDAFLLIISDISDISDTFLVVRSAAV